MGTVRIQGDDGEWVELGEAQIDWTAAPPDESRTIVRANSEAKAAALMAAGLHMTLCACKDRPGEKAAVPYCAEALSLAQQAGEARMALYFPKPNQED